MTALEDVPLLDMHSSNYVRARMLDRIDLQYAVKADGVWLTYLAAAMAAGQTAGKPLKVPEHAGWKWSKKLGLTERLLSYQTLAIEFEDVPQGLMMLRTDGSFSRLEGQEGKPLVYVEFLASAPWNLPAVVERPRFRGVGHTMMRKAIEISMDLEFKGRLALHSLPQADDYYRGIGMTLVGKDELKENLNYFEMSPDPAKAFIE